MAATQAENWQQNYRFYHLERIQGFFLLERRKIIGFYQ